MSSFNEYRRALQAFQSARLRRDHADLALMPQYRKLGLFFFDEIYGPRDTNDRDTGARRVHQFLHLVPGVTARDLEEVMGLLEMTNRLDDDLAERMLANNIPLPFDEALYEEQYREADNYDDRLKQLSLVKGALHDMHRLTRIPLLGGALKRAGIVARVAGLAVLHHFLVQGYEALRAVNDISYFTNTVDERELYRLNRIYGRV
ncbi:MAG: hypothetical protein MUD01_28705 [Chloroflexaceae bacterium]|jgi:hypothetical protein|nr:hypothetical protein [Chloroflexaceae bacterium]